jgi:hypothetical protein
MNSIRTADERQFVTSDNTALFYRHWPAVSASAMLKVIVLFLRVSVVTALRSPVPCRMLKNSFVSLINEENNAQAGEALFVLWRRKRLQTLSLAERQQGALKQCRRTMWFIVMLWAAWLLALLWY